MTENSSVSIDEVRALVAERHRYDEWLSGLEARKGSTPDHVFARVRADYELRRADVLEKLYEHSPSLQKMLAELEGRATSLKASVQAEEDERAEAMLRHAVGEFDDSVWEEVRSRVESALSSLETERASLDVQLTDVRDLLASARKEETDAGISVALDASEVLDLETESVDDIIVDSSYPETASSDAIGDTAVEVSGLDVADIELTPEPLPDAKVVQDHPARSSFWGSGNTPRSSDEVPGDVFGDAQSSDVTDSRETDAVKDAFDELAFLRSVIDPEERNPVVPKSAPTSGEAQKTLRCTECGTMNLPTEWYCERCGGELAAF